MSVLCFRLPSGYHGQYSLYLCVIRIIYFLHSIFCYGNFSRPSGYVISVLDSALWRYYKGLISPTIWRFIIIRASFPLPSGVLYISLIPFSFFEKKKRFLLSLLLWYYPHSKTSKRSIHWGPLKKFTSSSKLICPKISVFLFQYNRQKLCKL